MNDLNGHAFDEHQKNTINDDDDYDSDDEIEAVNANKGGFSQIFISKTKALFKDVCFKNVYKN